MYWSSIGKRFCLDKTNTRIGVKHNLNRLVLKKKQVMEKKFRKNTMKHRLSVFE